MAKHGNRKHPVKASTGNAENIDAPGSAVAPNPAKVHSFSRTIAKEHGEKAAVLLQYLAHHVSKSKHVHGGKKWFYKTLDDLAVVFPYLKRSTIHAILQKLGKENGPLVIGDYNKKGYDRTCWYAFADDNFRKQAQSSKPVYFQVEEAVQYGIVAAVLLGNLVHWIRENRKQDPKYTWHQILPGDLVEHLPFSKSTMQRALRDLVKAKVLKIKALPGKGESVEYALVNETRLTDEEPGSGSKLDDGGSKLDMPGSKRDMGGSILDMRGSKLDNNTTSLFVGFRRLIFSGITVGIGFGRQFIREIALQIARLHQGVGWQADNAFVAEDALGLDFLVFDQPPDSFADLSNRQA
jgi:hypothetical protein